MPTDLERKEKIVKNIKENYGQVEKSIVEQLYMKHDLHGTTVGSQREDIWDQLFEMVLPKKFVMEQSVFIIDSKNGVSNEVDLAIMDELYTPYIFRYGRLKFIPIEAVAAVVECKSTEIKKDAIKTWCDSIKSLRTSGESITRIATTLSTSSVKTQKSTRPIRILCALKESKPSADIRILFDFVLLAVNDKESNKTSIEITHSETFENLFAWYKELNFYNFEMPEELSTQLHKAVEGKTLSDYRVVDQGASISLLTFNFQLNQLLMLINNPMMFPHRAYVDMFNGKTGAT